jgi:hypothetical protein
VIGKTLDLGTIETELQRILARTTDLEPLATLEHPGAGDPAGRLATVPHGAAAGCTDPSAR